MYKKILPVYWALCFFLTHLPPSGLPAGIQGLDEGAHFFGYALLGFLFAACQREPKTNFLKIIAWLGLYAFIDEGTQPFVGREFDFLDITADLLGASLGVGVFLRTGPVK